MTMKFYLDDVWGKTKTFINSNSLLDSMIYKTYIESDTRLGSLDNDSATVVVSTYLQKVIILDQIDQITQAINAVLERDGIKCIVVEERDFTKNSPIKYL